MLEKVKFTENLPNDLQDCNYLCKEKRSVIMKARHVKVRTLHQFSVGNISAVQKVY